MSSASCLRIRKEAPQQQLRPPPLPALSLTWLALCTSLVYKHQELLTIFFSFVSSFLVATFVQLTIYLHRHWKNHRNINKDDSADRRIHSALPGVCENCCCTPRTRKEAEEKKRDYAKVKNIVGVIATSISLLLLSYRFDFEALSIVTGYLAFSLWYAPLFCKPLMITNLWSNVWEDAILVTACVIWLARWPSPSPCNENFNDDYSSGGSQAVFFLSNKRGTLIGLWTVYKMTRLVLSLLLPAEQHYYGTGCEQNGAIETSCTTTDVHNKSHNRSLTLPATKNTNNIDLRVPTRALEHKSKLWKIHGAHYDLNDFVSRHPGGKEAILLGRDRDCTALFESYHPFTNQHRVVLSKYVPVATDPMMVKSNVKDVSPRGSSTNSYEPDDFYDVLKQRVHTVLQTHGICSVRNRCASPIRIGYYFLILGGVVFTGVRHVQKVTPVDSFLFALFGWWIGALGHDAGHYAAFSNPHWNNICVWAMSLLCNPILWQHQHTYAHHSHTNELHQDPDLHHFENFMRVHRKFQLHQARDKRQKNVFYVFFVYTFVVFGTCIMIPLDVIRTGFLYGMVEYTDRGRPMRALGMYLHYVGYLTVVVLGPFWFTYFSTLETTWLSLLLSWGKAGVCVVTHIGTAGLLFAIFSQINHLNEPSLEPFGENDKQEDGSIVVQGKTGRKKLKVSSSWAARQIIASNNFAIDSSFWHIMSNGLNMQIEHHLFPGLNHCHLHLIAPTVKSTCDEFGVNYKCYESWREVMGATLNWLDKLSADETLGGKIKSGNKADPLPSRGSVHYPTTQMSMKSLSMGCGSCF